MKPVVCAVEEALVSPQCSGLTCLSFAAGSALSSVCGKLDKKNLLTLWWIKKSELLGRQGFHGSDTAQAHQ